MNEEQLNERVRINQILSDRFDEISKKIDNIVNIREIYELKIARDEVKMIYELINKGEK